VVVVAAAVALSELETVAGRERARVRVRQRPGGRPVVPGYAPASRYPDGMTANLAPQRDDVVPGPRALLAMMAAGPTASLREESEML
jgi:hypothetical protein